MKNEAKNEGTGEYIRVKGGYFEVRMKMGEGKLSSTGKSTILASTDGFKEVEGLEGGKANVMLIKK